MSRSSNNNRDLLEASSSSTTTTTDGRDVRKATASVRRKTPLPPPVPRYRRLRKSLHAACFFVFAALPFFDVMRFDLPRQRFYFAGNELWISEFAILLFSLMFLLFAIVAMTLLYGRVYCGYLCPQNIFSEAAVELEQRVHRFVTRKFIDIPAGNRRWIERGFVWTILAPASVFLAFIFMAYFVEPRDLLHRLMSLDVVTAGGLSGLVVTILTFLDFAFLRHRFCTTVCPYGFLQSMLVDDSSLLVVYREPEPNRKACIECRKCVRVCNMGIDIRLSPHQMECTHCGECIDACDEVLARVGEKGLIHYAWGESGAISRDSSESSWQRLGMRDFKRFGTVAIFACYFAGLMVYLERRHAVYVRVSPERSLSLYRVAEDGAVRNDFKLRIANRSREAGSVILDLSGLPEARIIGPSFQIRPGEELEFPFTIESSRRDAPMVQHFQLRAVARPANTQDKFELTFLSPQAKPSEEKH